MSGNLLLENLSSLSSVSEIVYSALNVVRFLLRRDKVLFFQLTKSISLTGASGSPSTMSFLAITAKISSSEVMILSLLLVSFA